MLSGLDQVAASFAADPVAVASASEPEDVHHFVELEASTTQHGRNLALKLHRTQPQRADCYRHAAVCSRLHRYDYVVAQTLGDLRSSTIAEQAGDESVIPSYTHLQRAEPVLVAHWLLAYVSMIERDLSQARSDSTQADEQLCPLGSGAVAGATLALDRKIAAEGIRL